MYDRPLQTSITTLRSAVASVPLGKWGVGVSGGADSVALLLLLREFTSASLHVIHLDHETRDGESAADAEFVIDLCRSLGMPVCVEKRNVVEARSTDLPKNVAARFRKARFELFRSVVAAESLDGVILAHHADDRTETVMQRILRGSGPGAVQGMSPASVVDGLQILRPLLAVRSEKLRDFLISRGQAWREDQSNASDRYLRNRLRRWLAEQPQMHETVLRIAEQSGRLKVWLDAHSPELSGTFSAEKLAGLCDPLARHAGAKWLARAGVPHDQLTRDVVERLVNMATDVASSPRVHFPGSILVSRSRGVIKVCDVCKAAAQPAVKTAQLDSPNAVADDSVR